MTLPSSPTLVPLPPSTSPYFKFPHFPLLLSLFPSFSYLFQLRLLSLVSRPSFSLTFSNFTILFHTFPTSHNFPLHHFPCISLLIPSYFIMFPTFTFPHFILLPFTSAPFTLPYFPHFPSLPSLSLLFFTSPHFPTRETKTTNKRTADRNYKDFCLWLLNPEKET